MSQTERTRRWVKTATADELRMAHGELQRDLAGTTNALIRSSMREQIRLVEAALAKR